ncbi:hypothetical protein AGMMS50268_00960 [Spirochaetia bacterium]|nr:hypothetical protein AGMMS50268_00960 [Spirochaetia bacterium]
MKKSVVQFTIIRAAAILAVIALTACGSSPRSGDSASSGRKVSGRVPQFASDALRNAPENALVAIGTAKMATTSQSMTTARNRGRAEISRVLDSMVRDMIVDHTASSEVDPSAALAFQENITVTLSESRLEGSSEVDGNFDDNGNYWAVMMLSKSGAVQEINQAVSAAKLAVPKMAAFDAQKRMDEEFAKRSAEEVPIADKDKDKD